MVLDLFLLTPSSHTPYIVCLLNSPSTINTNPETNLGVYFYSGLLVNPKVEVQLKTDGCSGTSNEVRYLEHVQSIITLTTARRGEVEIFLTSAGGTRSTLLTSRVRDMSTDGFSSWAFMTTHSWGEAAAGTWLLEVRNGASVGMQIE